MKNLNFMRSHQWRSFHPAFRLLCLDAAFAMAYDSWMGPVYLSGLAGELGVSVKFVSFLTGLPWIGLVGQLLGLYFISKFYSPKRYTLIVTTLGRGLWLVPFLSALYYTLHSSKAGVPFPKERWIMITAVCACLISVFSSMGAAAWMSWVKGLVPLRFRGRFFGIRHRFVMIGIAIANLVAAIWISWKVEEYLLGYVMIGLLALLAGLISLLLLWQTPDVVSIEGVARPGSFSWSDIKKPFAHRDFKVLLFFWPIVHGAVQIASPYFPFHFTKELGFSMSTVAFWTMLANLGGVFAAIFWASKMDQTKGTLKVILISGLAISLSPVLYLFASKPYLVWLAPIEHFINGGAWAAMVMSTMSLMLKAVPDEQSGVYFSVYFAFFGLCGASGVFLGGEIAGFIKHFGYGLKPLWAVGCFSRLIVFSFLYMMLIKKIIVKNFSA